MMPNLATIRSKVDFIASLNPQAWDAVHPHTPFLFSNVHVELLVADVVKHVGVALADKASYSKVLELSRKMATQASASLVGAWEPGDDLCPPWNFPFPGPRPLNDFRGPSPEPWQTISSAEQIELAYTLTNLAALTTSAEFNASLKTLATSIVGGVASQLEDDFERCGTKPRKPFPPRPGLTGAQAASSNAA